jgi:acetylornithine deacetylase/succinyl-diaminopimelate desuccinylase-like protein
MNAGGQRPSAPDERARTREIFKELVETPTTEADGTARAAQKIATRLTAAGFPAGDVQLVGPNPRATSLVARFRGRNRDARAILMMAHLDVVPARREDWSRDPWTLTEQDGWFYGRGTHDNKAGAAILAANFIRLKREGWQPDRDLIIALTGDEETAEECMPSLLSQHRSLVDAEVAFNTDAGGVIVKKGRPAMFDLQTSEKIYADYQLELTDAGGHSSLPRPDNPIYALSAALVRIGDYQFPLHMTDETRVFLERSAATESGQLASDLREVAVTSSNIQAAARLSRVPFYNARLRTTCVATRVDAGHANNALPQTARAVINCRILPGLSGAEVEAVLRRLAGDKIKLSVLTPPVSSPPSPSTSSWYSDVEHLAARHFPGLPIVPTMETGATDGMYTRSAGIPTYGISALEEDPDDIRSHGKDERVRVESFYTAAEFWFELAKTLGGR